MLLGLAISAFSLVGRETPIGGILILSFALGFIASLQFTSMNTLVYADVDDRDASQAGSIASTAQQMSLSFGVAVASLTTAIFIPDRLRADPAMLMHGIHGALLSGAGRVVSSSTLCP